MPTSLLAVQDCVYDWVASMGIVVAGLNGLLHLSRYHSQARDAAITPWIEIQPVKIWIKDEGIRSAGNIAMRAHLDVFESAYSSHGSQKNTAS